MHRQYGPVVRIAPNEISIAHRDGWRDIYAARPGHKPFPKNPLWWGGKSVGIPESLINAEDPADHERMRKLINPAFTVRAVEAQEPIIQSYVDLLISRLRDRVLEDSSGTGAVVDIVQWYNFTTFDIVGDLGFGEPFDCLKNSKYHPWVSSIFSHFKLGVFVAAARFYPIVAKMMVMCIPANVSKPAMRNRLLAHEKINRRLNLETERNDFMSPVIRNNDERSMTLAEIQGTFNTVIVAGSETTATLLSGITNYTLRYPSVHQKLKDEIRSAFEKEEEITFAKVKDLTYLNAVIHEGMRMCPPSPAGLARVVPRGGETACGCWFPGGVGRKFQFQQCHPLKRPNETR